MPDFKLETEAALEGFKVICGVDEAGRGPWAGPVVAGACILDRDNLSEELLSGLDDSKKLKPVARAALFERLKQEAVIGIGSASVEEIDELNILAATLLAMKRAVADLGVSPDLALIDGNKLPDLDCEARYVVKGDGKSLSIAAASIVAKVTRDREMALLDENFPGYGWASNAGYGTKAHVAALEELGVTEHHRKSYKPIKKILGLE